MRTRHGLKAGDRVRSHYRAGWSGEIISTKSGWVNKFGETQEPGCGYHIPDGCCLVRVDRDRAGNPQRKVLFKVLSARWLSRL